MSVAELKSQAARLSFEELRELAHHLRSLALTKDPKRKTQLHDAQTSGEWLAQAEFEKTLDELERDGR
jgi:hypothetical protein